jgi:hypothetical protein
MFPFFVIVYRVLLVLRIQGLEKHVLHRGNGRINEGYWDVYVNVVMR